MYYTLTMNDTTYFYLDGYYYTFDTLFDDISV